MDHHHFKGTKRLTTLIFKQDRFKILIWLLGVVMVSMAALFSYPSIYKTAEDRLNFGLTMDNPVMKAMLGPGYLLGEYTTGALFANEMLLFTAIAVAIMNILLVSRSTRWDEEVGLLEMIRSLPVGRLAYLTAAMIVAFIINFTLMLATGFGLYSLGIAGISFESAILYGVILGATGMFFAALTAVVAQLAQTSRGTISITLAMLSVSYLIRAIGDVSMRSLSYLSPLGWTVNTYVFVHNSWWPIILFSLSSILLIFVAFSLNRIRDLDEGFITPRKGKAHASRLLKTPIGFIFRLQRTNILAWAIGLFLLSAAFGAILGDLETYFADMAFIQDFLPGGVDSLTNQFIALLIKMLSLIGVIPTIMVILKLKEEEQRNRVENFYSRSISKNKLLGSYYGVAVLVSILMQVMLILGLWLVGKPFIALSFKTIFYSAIAFLPVFWFMIGLCILFIGIGPKATGLIWPYITFCFITSYLGTLLHFPTWLVKISVFEQTPQLAIDNFSILPLAFISLLAFVLSIIGFIGYNRRDIKG
jgi:ABC-2 type transport system permease protein